MRIHSRVIFPQFKHTMIRVKVCISLCGWVLIYGCRRKIKETTDPTYGILISIHCVSLDSNWRETPTAEHNANIEGKRRKKSPSLLLQHFTEHWGEVEHSDAAVGGNAMSGAKGWGTPDLSFHLLFLSDWHLSLWNVGWENEKWWNTPWENCC